MLEKLLSNKKDKVVSEIYQTSDYKKFSFLKTNREINYRHLERLEKSMLDNGVDESPITVNVKFQILDGQHRFKVLEKLGQPIFYRVISCNDSEKQVVTMNTNNKNWSNEDYLKMHVIKEKIKFPRNYFNMPYHLISFGRKKKINITILVRLASNSQSNRYLEDFQKGRLTIANNEDFVSMINYLSKLVEINKFCGHRNFQRAFLGMLEDGFDKAIFITKLAKYPRMLQNNSTTKGYQENIMEIYNYRSKKNNKLK
tara:strand:- start:93 stop:860 length:768 start_codon:yes stop_codon:yes gene_type:complete